MTRTGRTRCHPLLPSCFPAPLLLVLLLILLVTVAGNNKLAGSWTIDTPLDSAYNYLFHAEHTGACPRILLSGCMHRALLSLRGERRKHRADFSRVQQPSCDGSMPVMFGLCVPSAQSATTRHMPRPAVKSNILAELPRVRVLGRRHGLQKR
jgi:hypothetical protein